MLEHLASNFEALWGETSGVRPCGQACGFNMVRDIMLGWMVVTARLQYCGEVGEDGFEFILGSPRQERRAQ